MKNLSREAIKRMTGAQGSTTTIGGSGGGDMAGYATQLWTDENYVGKEFFRSLFKAYDANGNEVLPNDTNTQIDNIKAMFGFWTDFYISALGTGGQSTVGLRLAQLADVNVAGVTNGQVLTYDTTSGKWIASTPQSGTDMATVWVNLAASGNQQINYSHLSGAVSLSNGTITIGSSSITPITSHQSLAGYAKETWVGQNYLPLAGGTINGNLNVTGKLSVASKLVATQEWVGQNYISIAYFDRLFRAYNGSTLVNHNDTSSTIDNIKAMFGFWTDFYISALGTGGQQSVGLRLAQLADVNVAGVTNGQVLTYNSTTGKWVASTPQSGTDMATVWANLAAVDNTKQIDGSHLTTALTGYATQTWVGQQGYITSSAISDMATKTWVGQQGYITSSAISDMATKTWANGQFLKLSGGTLTGKLQVNAVVFGYNYTNSNNAAAFVFDKPGSKYTGIGANGVSDQIYFGACNGDGVWQNYLQKWYFNGSLIANGDITIKNNGRISQTAELGGALYLGTSNNYGWVRIQDVCSQDGNAGDDYWSIRTSGAAIFTSVYSKTYVTALSDARHKNVIGDTGLTVEQIAGAPAIRFTWNDRDDKTVFAGSIAQYWQKVLPEVVQSQADCSLSLDYQVAALISSITVARKVMNHESRLLRLERMFALNENDIEE